METTDVSAQRKRRVPRWVLVVHTILLVALAVLAAFVDDGWTWALSLQAAVNATLWLGYLDFDGRTKHRPALRWSVNAVVIAVVVVCGVAAALDVVGDTTNEPARRFWDALALPTAEPGDRARFEDGLRDLCDVDGDTIAVFIVSQTDESSQISGSVTDVEALAAAVTLPSRVDLARLDLPASHRAGTQAVLVQLALQCPDRLAEFGGPADTGAYLQALVPFRDPVEVIQGR